MELNPAIIQLEKTEKLSKISELKNCSTILDFNPGMIQVENDAIPKKPHKKIKYYYKKCGLFKFNGVESSNNPIGKTRKNV